MTSLKRKGYGSIVDVSACRPDMLGDLGGRKGALLAEKSARFGNVVGQRQTTSKAL
jgi:hypothetical protein